MFGYDKPSILFELSSEVLYNDEYEDFVKLLLQFISEYTNDSVNFIITNGGLDTIQIVYLSDDIFISEDRSGGYNYYNFFKGLLDNNFRNIVYIADSIKEKF